MVKLRASQRSIMRYRKGRMGIAAVPGSGKTWTLSLLAAEIVARGILEDDQEVLIVTLVNSAVDNFHQRISQFITERGLLPETGYRVRTLHGLAHDIVRDRPALVGLETGFTIIDNVESEAIIEESGRSWLRSNPDFIDNYMSPDIEGSSANKARRDEFPKLVGDISKSLIRSAKDMRLPPGKLQERLRQLPIPMPLVEMGCQIYTDYQSALKYRGAVDFDDLIHLAMLALESEPTYLDRLRHKWPYIMEDEAQDSSRLQEEILEKLAGKNGNWVRVGDANQAIYETFTTASPEHLLRFLKQKKVKERNLPESGRSATSLISLANHLVEWSMTQEVVKEVQDALHAPPYIEPVSKDDPNSNPPDETAQIYISMQKRNPQEETKLVVDSLAKWFGNHDNQDKTVAVLVPRQERGFEMVDALSKRGIPFEDGLLKSSVSTRSSAGLFEKILDSLADPGKSNKLALVFEQWSSRLLKDELDDLERQQAVRKIRGLAELENYLYPGPDFDWLGEMERSGDDDSDLILSLAKFREVMHGWQPAVLLPVDQLVLTLAQDLLSEPAELAVSHKLALLLRLAGQIHPSWRLPELIGELKTIARNERKFLGFSATDLGFDPQQYKGKVVVATMHGAKGLEWDRVYLTSVNNYDFPFAQPYDQYLPERWFVRGKLNLEAEALAQFQAVLTPDPYAWYEEGRATFQARLDYTRERLRLLYVGITRARRELVITWNTGRRGDLQPALPLVELHQFWQDYLMRKTDDDSA